MFLSILIALVIALVFIYSAGKNNKNADDKAIDHYESLVAAQQDVISNQAKTIAEVHQMLASDDCVIEEEENEESVLTEVSADSVVFKKMLKGRERLIEMLGEDSEAVKEFDDITRMN